MIKNIENHNINLHDFLSNEENNTNNLHNNIESKNINSDIPKYLKTKRLNSLLNIIPIKIVDINSIYNEIIPNLYLGRELSVDEINESGFDYILSITCHEPLYYNDDNSMRLVTKWINFKDNGSSVIKNHFEECCEFINLGLSNGKKVYVHCKMGISRSPTIIIAYLMINEKLSFIEARNIVSSARPCIHLKIGFYQLLKKYDKEINN